MITRRLVLNEAFLISFDWVTRARLIGLRGGQADAPHGSITRSLMPRAGLDILICRVKAVSRTGHSNKSLLVAVSYCPVSG